MKICKILFCLTVAFSLLILCGCGSSSDDLMERPSTSISKIGSYYQQGIKIGPYYERKPNYVLEGVKKPWLFFVYIAGDNDDIIYNQLANIDSLEAVGSDNNTHIVTYIDIGDPKEKYGWESSEWSKNIDWSGARGYYITKNSEEYVINSPVITEYGKVDSGSKEFFATCLKEAMTKFPADNICVVLNNHGAGYLGLLCDYSEDTIMSNNSLKEAIKEVEESTGKKVNILGFDACLMAEIETAYEYKDVTDYIIASEELTSSIGWHYEEILTSSKSKNANKITTNSKFGILPRVTKLIQTKYEENNDVEENSSETYSKIAFGVTPSQFSQLIFEVTQQYKDEVLAFSVIDTSKLEDIKNTVNDFAKNVIDTDEENLTFVADNILLNPQNSNIYYALEYGMMGGYQLFDLYNMMNTISSCNDITDQNIKTSANNVKSALSKAVISNTNSGDMFEEYDYSYGLSILFSYSTNYIIDLDVYQNLAFTKETKWLDMIKKIEELYSTETADDEETDDD